MTPAKILLIAPYKGMVELAEQIAAKRSDILLDTKTGDLEEAVALTKQIAASDYDAIISRGGTAQLLVKVLKIPVFSIHLSEYDMLRALLLAKNCQEPYAVVGFRNVIECVDLVSALLDISIPTHILTGGEDVRPFLLSLKENGISLVVGDTVTVTTARNMGMNAILITSGEEGISSAFDTVVQAKRARLEAETRCAVLYEVLDHCALDFVTFNDEGNVVHKKCRLLDDQKLISLTSRYLKQLKKNGNFELSTKCGDTFVRLDGYTWQSEEILYVFYCKISDGPNTSSITPMLRPPEEMWMDFSCFYSSCDPVKHLTRLTTAYARTTLPTVIAGETGTLADCFAWELYQNCPGHGDPCFVVDCTVLSAKDLQFLMENINSPLYNNGITIYIRQLQDLDLEKQKELLSYIKNTSLHTRNRVIYSFCPPLSGNLVVSYLTASCCCQVLTLPPLRERRAEMHSLAGICLNEINVRHGRQMLGIQPDAMELLLAYDWPQNIPQFIRILTDCALSSPSTSIDMASLQAALDREQLLTASRPEALSLPRGTLEEINRYLVFRILKEEQGNQSRAARRLGISRSTLWRMMKGMPETD